MKKTLLIPCSHIFSIVCLSRTNFLFDLGGAGGKGTWGQLGSELQEVDEDMNDPNYDSDSLDNGDIELKSVIPEMSEEDLQVSYPSCGVFSIVDCVSFLSPNDFIITEIS